MVDQRRSRATHRKPGRSRLWSLTVPAAFVAVVALLGVISEEAAPTDGNTAATEHAQQTSATRAAAPSQAVRRTGPGPSPASAPAVGHPATLPSATPDPSADTADGTQVAAASPQAAEVGALFDGGISGGHFCSASVVHSPGRNLLITAAHCLDAPGRTVFIPDYRDGTAPYGVWPVTRILAAPGWTDGSDPDLDVAFLVVGAQAGKQIEDVVQADTLDTAEGFTTAVQVFGYPDSGDAPIACDATTARFSRYQRRIRCPGFSSGTSGGPWITGTGSVIAVTGGFQRGGDSDDVSYSAYFDQDIATLYRAAVTAAQ